MSTKRMLIMYYTGSGNTKRMAEEVGKGAEQLGIKVEVKSIEECGVNDLAEADGIVIGSPTYFSNVAWQVKKLIDESCMHAFGFHHRMRMVPGIIGASGDSEEQVSKMCQQYGMEIAKQILP